MDWRCSTNGEATYVRSFRWKTRKLKKIVRAGARWRDTFKMDLQGILCNVVDWI
jgi:hypothetical protein